MTKYLIVILILVSNTLYGQSVIDSCFASVTPATNFESSATLANNATIESDVIEWTGTDWIGTWPNANIVIPPPGNIPGSRAIFLGNGSSWTTGGEGFCMLLSSPLVAGQSYSFEFTYVSHGYGSNGNFAPFFYSSDVPTIDGNGDTTIGTLPGVGYTWETNTITFTASPAQDGDTWLAIHSGNSGTSGLVYQLCGALIPSCNIDLGNDVALCEGETLTLDATTTDATYLWQDNSTNPTLDVNQPGTYWVEVTVDNCTDSDTINIDYNPIPTIDLGNDVSLCQGETLTLDATTSNATYLWQDNSTNPTFDVSQQGTYSVEITVNNCIASDAINVNYNPSPIIDLGNDFSLCQGETLTLDVTTPNATYLWQDNSTNPIFEVSQQGTYSIEVTVDNCTASDFININYNPIPTIDLGEDMTICPGEISTLDATSPNATYLWQDNSTNPTLDIDQEGTYWVEVTIANCTASDTINLSNTPIPNIDLGEDLSLCQGEMLTIDATTTNATYLWQDNSSNPTLDVNQEGTYWVEVTLNNCTSDTDSINIVLENCNCSLDFPNIFTPNSDNLNDGFSGIANCDFTEYHLMIFNRWGQKIFDTKSSNDSWDGTYEGKMSTSEVYIYLANYKFMNSNNDLSKKGSITLIR